MRLLAFLLYPLAVLYDLITSIRNWFFDLGLFKSTQSPIPSILVGNLSVGGTGKTPMIEYLIKKFNSEYSIATLSRGYGRDTTGFIKADKSSSPSTIGDEPFQVYQKFGKNIQVYVGENRVKAVQAIHSSESAPQLLLLDDAYQHRSIKTHVSILLTTYQKPFYRDFLLPSGRLRENRKGANRADLVVVTKCPNDLSAENRTSMKQEIFKFTKSGIEILFSSIQYSKPYSLGFQGGLPRMVILISGIASDEPLIDYVQGNYELIEKVSYKDHYQYTSDDINRIKLLLKSHENGSVGVLLTEKDAEKVKSVAPKGFLEEFPIFVLPMTVSFSEKDENTLMNLLQLKIKEISN